MKALQNSKALANKVERNEIQLKLTKNTGTIMAPCDKGKNHHRIRHWMKNLTFKDVPTVAFVTQHSRQRCTMLNNFKVMGAFSEVFDTVELEQEQIRQKHFKERCWRENELEASAE